MHESTESGGVRRRPGFRSAEAAAYEILTMGLYGLMRMGHALVPQLRQRLAPRLALDLEAGAGKRLIHFHAASVGEISSAAPVVGEIRKETPGTAVLVTTMTVTGRRRAAEAVPDARTLIVPFDFRPAMRRFMDTFQPALTIIVETELWPNLIGEAARREVPLVLVNGRISARSLGRYRLLRPLVGAMLERFDLLLMRSHEDARRIISLGADPGRVEVTGNTKYDVLPAPPEAGRRAALKRAHGIDESRPVIMLGSARPGESEILLGALERLDLEVRPVVVLAPRHLETAAGVAAACRKTGYDVVFSAGGGAVVGGGAAEDGRRGPDRKQAIVVDEMGRLLDYYTMCDIALVGGTFRPHGGHNPLEPASRGAVVIVGPHRSNIEDDVVYLMSKEAVLLAGEHDLVGVIRGLLGGEAGMRELGARAAAAVQSGKGAAKRCVEAMKSRGLLK